MEFKSMFGVAVLMSAAMAVGTLGCAMDAEPEEGFGGLDDGAAAIADESTDGELAATDGDLGESSDAILLTPMLGLGAATLGTLPLTTLGVGTLGAGMMLPAATLGATMMLPPSMLTATMLPAATLGTTFLPSAMLGTTLLPATTLGIGTGLIW